MATYYVSKSFDNGYVSGSDVNDGLSKTTPFLTVSRAVTAAAAAGDSIVVNAGVYSGTELGASGYVLLTKSVTIRAEVPRTVTFRTNTVNGLYRTQGPIGAAQVLDGIVLDGNGSSAVPNYTVFCEDVAGAYSVSLVNCDIRDAVFYLINVTATQITLSVMNSVFSASSLNTTRSFIYAPTVAAGGLTVNNVSGTLSRQATGAFGLLHWKATAANVSASVTSLTATMYLDSSLTSTGEHFGVQIVNCPRAIISKCNVSVVGAYGSRSSCLYRITSDAAIDTSFGEIKNCSGSNLTTGGYLALIGADATSAGDNQTNNGSIAYNTLYGNGALSPSMHGVMLGFNRGGFIIGNVVQYVGIGCLVKQNNPSTVTTPAQVVGNVVISPLQQGLRAKAAISTVFTKNEVYTTLRPLAGWAILADNDGATNSSNVVFARNSVYSLEHLQELVSVGVGSTATFVQNSYFSTQSFRSNSWAYQGTSYGSLASWNASGVASGENDASPYTSGVFAFTPLTTSGPI